MWSLAERIILSPQELIRSIISPVWFGRLTGSYGAFLVLLRRPEVSFAFQRQTLVPEELETLQLFSYRAGQPKGFSSPRQMQTGCPGARGFK